ncbi:hypothetical protein D3C74_271900 [compost metagenome]
MILSCGEWGHYYEKIILQYVDDTIEEILVNFYEWTLDIPASANTEAFRGTSMDQTTGETFSDAFLFAQNFVLKNYKQLSRIILPECPHAHIFSITLGSN